MSYALTPAHIIIDDGCVYAPDYEDIYFSREDGLAESRYVYLQGNHITERFATCNTRFTIGELGFGTGLNFLLTWQTWQQHAPAHASLHYIAIEKHPITRKELREIYQYFNGLTQECETLLAQYPPAICGSYTITLSDNVTLTLLYDDATTALPRIKNNSIDAWYLDGFNPANNTHMWGETLLATIGRKTVFHGTVATFTAARAVRDGLVAVGFEVTRISGYGHKRHMVTARYIAPCPAPSISYQYPDVTIIGAGIAGASLAHACAMRGAKVRVLEQHDAPAAEASGNKAAVLYPFMASQWDDATLFYLQAYSFLQSWLPQWDDTLYNLCGMVQTSKKPRDVHALQRLEALPQKLDLPVELTRWDASKNGLYFPLSGWVNMAGLVRTLLTHNHITATYNHNVASLDVPDNKTGYIALCNSQSAGQLLPQHILPMRTIRGQTTLVPERCVTLPYPHVISCSGTITPAIGGFHHISAIFDKNTPHATVNVQDHQRNIDAIASHFPAMFDDSLVYDALHGWAGLRYISGDRLPIAGLLYDANHMTALQHKSYNKHYTIEYRNNIILSCAHGTRGMLSAPYSAELLASVIDKGAAITQSLPMILDSARFALRLWRKQSAR